MTGEEKPVALEDRADTGGLLYSPSAARNKDAIAQVLDRVLPQGARVLEIGSGTGEHAEAACRRRPDLHWTPSDPDLRSRASVAARASSLDNLADPIDLDLLDARWADRAPACDALVCINVVHIAPFAVAEALARHAGAALPADGVAYLYGPFLEGGASAPSNVRFSEDLRRRDPAWGVRERAEVEALFDSRGWRRTARIEMPANNLSLLFEAAPA